MHAEVSHALCTGRRYEFLDSIVTGHETWVLHHTHESKQQSLQWRHTHSARTKKLKTSISINKSWCPFSGTEKAFSWWTSCLLVQQLMQLHIVTPWHGFDKPFKTRVVTWRVPVPRQRVAPFHARHHCTYGKIQVRSIGPSAVQSRPRATCFFT